MRASLIIVFAVVAFNLVSCGSKDGYQAIVERELGSGIRNDSLFLGIHFGMSQEDFYTRCWEMNKNQMVYQGPGNLSVLYKLPEELKYPGKMEFYPDFVNDSIYNMPVRYTYNGWSPPPSPYMSDSLQLDVKRLYEEWYGEGFITISDPEHGDAFVKVDGNRQISIFKIDQISVKVIFTDLTSSAARINN